MPSAAARNRMGTVGTKNSAAGRLAASTVSRMVTTGSLVNARLKRVHAPVHKRLARPTLGVVMETDE